MFSTDWSKVGEWLLAPFLRKAKLKAFAQVLLKPLEYLKDLYDAFEASTKKHLSYNSQTIALEQMLNDTYPDAGGDIYIDNTPDRFTRYFSWFESEGQPDLGYTYFESEAEGHFDHTYFKSEHNQEIDFTVMVPVALSFDEDEMRAKVKKYAAADKRFAIETF